MTLMMKTQEAWRRAKHLPQNLWWGMYPPCWAWISRQGVVLQRPDLNQRPLQSDVLHGDDLDTPWASAATELFKLCDRSYLEHQRLHVLFSDFWFKPFVLGLKKERAQESEMELLLKGQYQRLYGEASKSWTYAWDVCGDHVIAMASAQEGVDLVRQGLAERNIQLSGFGPASAQYLQSAPHRMSDGWMAMVQSDSLSLLRIKDQQICDWRTFAQTSSLTQDLLVHLSRQSARASEASRDLAVVDLSQSLNQRALLAELAQAGWQSEFVDLAAPSMKSVAKWLALLEVKPL